MDKRIHAIYQSMISRCKADSKCFKNYVGNGIRVCDEWMNDYKKFEDWAVSNGYADGLCIDRMDTRKGYFPENCRWATLKENARNRIDTVFVEYKGTPVKLCELCEANGVRYSVVYSRLRAGWDLDRAISVPVRRRVSSKYGPSKSVRSGRTKLKTALPYMDVLSYKNSRS